MVKEGKYSERSPLNPRSPSNKSIRLLSSETIKAGNIFAVNGILFNHESPLRGENFVTRKITVGIARILLNKQKIILLGNLSAKRDWGHAKDYVKAMWKMLQQKTPDDYIIATGRSHSVREFLKKSFSIVGIEIGFKGKGIDECGFIKSIQPKVLAKFTKKQFEIGQVLVLVDKSFFRPLEVDHLEGNALKAKEYLKWEPEYDFNSLVEEMVLSDIKLLK